MMFALRSASNPLKTRLQYCLTASYHTKSNILHNNNFRQTQPHDRNLFTFIGFSPKPDINGEQEDVKDGSSAPSIISDPEEVRSAPFDLFTAIANAPSRNVYAALDKCTEALKHVEIRDVLRKLSKCKMYGTAYQLSNWLETKGVFKFEEEIDYATQLDLIAKVRGMALAEKYMDESIPGTFKGRRVYDSLLYNYVLLSNVKRAEQVFDKMRDLGFLTSGFACQHMILLYKRLDKKKIGNVLLLMEENGVQPTRFTYQMLIDVKGDSKDIPGMEEVVEAMKSDGLELDNHIRAVLARHYIFAGFNDKAGEILKQMEGEDLEGNRLVCKDLLPLYADLGKDDEVERVWKVCESDARVDDYLAAISAFGKVGRVEKAEEVFEKRIESGKNLSSKGCAALLNVYVDHKLLAKGKDLAKRMDSVNHPIDRLVWDTLVKLYVYAGEVEKADSILHRATQQHSKEVKPSYRSFQLIMDQYSRRGDIHNTEKIFQCLKQSGFDSKIWHYQSLLRAYIKAKAPGYGFRERMMADNLIPSEFVAAQLAQVDPFKKTAIAALSDLLD